MASVVSSAANANISLAAATLAFDRFSSSSAPQTASRSRVQLRPCECRTRDTLRWCKCQTVAARLRTRSDHVATGISILQSMSSGDGEICSKPKHIVSHPSHIMPHPRDATVLAHAMMEAHSSGPRWGGANFEGSGYPCRVRQCAARSLHSGQTEASAGADAW